jgi:hypothetical protein
MMPFCLRGKDFVLIVLASSRFRNANWATSNIVVHRAQTATAGVEGRRRGCAAAAAAAAALPPPPPRLRCRAQRAPRTARACDKSYCRRRRRHRCDYRRPAAARTRRAGAAHTRRAGCRRCHMEAAAAAASAASQPSTAVLPQCLQNLSPEAQQTNGDRAPAAPSQSAFIHAPRRLPYAQG